MPSRRQLLSRIGFGLLAGRFTGLALAQAQPAVPPAEVLASMPDARWIGGARFRYFGWSVYDASLWAGPGFNANGYASQRFALSLLYLRAFSGKEIALRSMQQIRLLAKLPAETDQTWLHTLQDVLPGVAAGERLTGLHGPGSLALWHQGRALATVSDAQLAARFFGIWLDPATSEPRLRQALLAGAIP